MVIGITWGRLRLRASAWSEFKRTYRANVIDGKTVKGLRGEETGTDAAADAGPPASETCRGITTGPEPHSGTNLDRPIPWPDKLVGLSGAADGRVLARHLRRRS